MQSPKHYKTISFLCLPGKELKKKFVDTSVICSCQNLTLSYCIAYLIQFLLSKLPIPREKVLPLKMYAYTTPKKDVNVLI